MTVLQNALKGNSVMQKGSLRYASSTISIQATTSEDFRCSANQRFYMNVTGLMPEMENTYLNLGAHLAKCCLISGKRV